MRRLPEDLQQPRTIRAFGRVVPVPGTSLQNINCDPGTAGGCASYVGTSPLLFRDMLPKWVLWAQSTRRGHPVFIFLEGASRSRGSGVSDSNRDSARVRVRHKL